MITMLYQGKYQVTAKKVINQSLISKYFISQPLIHFVLCYQIGLNRKPITDGFRLIEVITEDQNKTKYIIQMG